MKVKDVAVAARTLPLADNAITKGGELADRELSGQRNEHVGQEDQEESYE